MRGLPILVRQCSWTDFESRKILDQPRDGLFASRESHLAIHSRVQAGSGRRTRSILCARMAMWDSRLANKPSLGWSSIFRDSKSVHEQDTDGQVSAVLAFTKPARAACPLHPRGSKRWHRREAPTHRGAFLRTIGNAQRPDYA